MRHALTVLYGEDDPAEADRVRAHLTRAAPELLLEIVSSAAEFIALARARRHGLFLLRHHPPAMDALALLTSLRLDHSDAPFVIVADAIAGDFGSRALRLGADGLLPTRPEWWRDLPRQLGEVADRRRPSLLAPMPRLRPHRALIVENRAKEADDLLRQLTNAIPTLTIEIARSVSAGLERLAEACDFDVLLTVHRPDEGLDAHAFLSGARDRRLLLPVILIGQADDEAAMLAAFEAGAADFVVFDQHVGIELPLRVELAIERAELAQANARATAELMQRQRTLGALRESEKQLNLALEAGRVGLWTWYVGTGHTQFSSHWKAQIGYSDDEVRNDSAEWESRCHPDDLVHLKQMITRYLAAPWPDFTVEYRMRHKDGSWRSFLLHADLEFDAHERPIRMIGSQVDVTTLKQQQTELAGASARLQQLSRRLLEFQEAERRHLARELHDEIGQVLTVAKIHLQSAALASPATGVASQLQEPITLLDRLLAQVRSLSLNLRPPPLDDLGLVPALHWLVQQPQARTSSPRVSLATDREIGRYDPALETACFRIAQEALTNALRHSRAKMITVSLSLVDNKLQLGVLDDGIGFDAVAARSRAEAGASLGLLGMHERALLAGGALTLLSAPGRGTRVEAVFPLSNIGETLTIAP